MIKNDLNNNDHLDNTSLKKKEIINVADIDNKEILAIANSVIVAMDLNNRKSVQIPYKMKNSLENIVLK